MFYIRKLFIQGNAGTCCVHITGGANKYLCMCVSIFVLVCHVCVMSSQSTSKNNVFHVKPSLNLISCCIDHTVSTIRNQGSKGNIIKGLVLDLRQFLTTENPFKKMKNVFYFMFKARLFLRYLNFCLTLLVLQKNDLIK